MCNVSKNIKYTNTSRNDITIPDGSKHKVSKIGDVPLNDNITLKKRLICSKFSIQF